MAKLRELWADLRSSPAGADGFSLRLFASAHDLRVYAALTMPGNASGILIELPTALRPRDLTKVTSRAFEATAANFSGLQQGRCAVSVVLQKAEYEDLFELLGEDIAGAINRAPSNQEAARAVVRRIERWRRFFERPNRQLSDEDMRGLIGELTVLARCIGKFSSAQAVNAWQGMGGLRDFELSEYSVEVKTYQAETGATIRISDPQQLEGSHARPVYLFVARLARSEVSGRTLGDMVLSVQQMLQLDAAASEEFQDRLADRGFVQGEAHRYTERFTVGNVQLFSVGDTFPRIMRASVPAGVTDVHFSILLSTIETYATDPAPLIGVASALEG